MLVRYKKTLETRLAHKFNFYGCSEVLTGDDSVSIKELDVCIDGVWYDMTYAFKERLIVPNNDNTAFGEPTDEAARKRGYNAM